MANDGNGMKHNQYIGPICLSYSDHFGSISLEIRETESCDLDPSEARELAEKLLVAADAAEKAPARPR